MMLSKLSPEEENNLVNFFCAELILSKAFNISATIIPISINTFQINFESDKEKERGLRIAKEILECYLNFLDSLYDVTGVSFDPNEVLQSWKGPF